MDAIPDCPCPKGYHIRPMRREETCLWTNIQRDAEPYLAISDGLFESKFGTDPAIIEQRCFLVLDAKSCAAGVISAWQSRLAGGTEIGRIHWLAIRRAHQGRGLGRAAISYALKRMAQWHDRACLDTSTERLGAVKLYLDFGFVPDMAWPGALEAWREVRRALHHPALEQLGL